jgi:protocatechuate 3,4-dioxygenase beta subunit
MGGFNRRQLLHGVGVVSLGGLLAACARDDSTAAATAEVTTTAGATATVQPSTTGGLTADRFDASATCAVSPELTEGPYYFDVDAIRSDIREDRQGATLRLGVRVRDAAGCTPIPSAVVDIWHCDALGTYSGFESASQGTGGGGGPGGGGGGPTDEETYLRGAQVTNADGIAEFLTVYPGWYRGRTVHIHAKVHIDRATALTTQLFFDEDVTARVYASEPYADDSGRDTFNDGDGIFDQSLVLTLSEEGDQVLGLMTLDVGEA